MSPYRFDALILTALLDELEPVLAFGEGGKDAWKRQKDSKGFPYHVRELTPENGGPPLLLAAASFNAMGEGVTAARAVALIEELNPACLAMCGICAGNKPDVALGDVIVADRLYNYEAGKNTVSIGEDGQRLEQLDHDLRTYNLEETWRVNAAYFARELEWTAELLQGRPPTREAQEDWLLRTLLGYEERGQEVPHDFGGEERGRRCPDFPKLWKRLRLPEHGAWMVPGGKPRLTDAGRERAHELKYMYPKGLEDQRFQVHVGPLATGSVVQKDPELFRRLEQLSRKTLGAEMEAVAIGLAAEQLKRRALVVKAASDHGDGEKNDGFRKFAARAASEVLLRFLRRTLEPAARQSSHEVDLPGRARPVDELLARVRRFTDVKESRDGWSVRLEVKPARPPLGSYLEVVKSKGPHLAEYPLAAVAHVTPEVLDAFLTGLHERYRLRDPRVHSTLVYEGAAPEPELVAKAQASGILLQSLADYMGVPDFSGYLKEQSRQLESARDYLSEFYVAQRASLTVEGRDTDIGNALEQVQRWMNERLGHLVLVLGDFGTGKTFLLRELALRMGRAVPQGPIPLFIELRRLEKKPTLDELIASELARAKINTITVAAIRAMLGDGGLALLFDGFDEYVQRVTYSQAADHLYALIREASEKTKIVITSRTQHFESEHQVREALTRGSGSPRGYQLLRLKPFDKAQIHQYLVKRLGDPVEAAKRSMLLDKLPDLPSLAVNPRMLSFILELPEQDLLKASQQDQTMTRSKLYEVLLESWLQGESARIRSGLSTKQRWGAVTELAMKLWLSGAPAIALQQLSNEFVETIQRLEERQLDTSEAQHQIGSGTLLVRDEEKKFSFIHQSVMEWLVAKKLAGSLQQGGAVPELGSQILSGLTVDFLCELAGGPQVEQWAQAALKTSADAKLQANALALLGKLGIEPSSRKSRPDQDLRGEDFSGRDLSRLDFSKADFTGVSLVRANLTGAKLVGAKLQRADLSEANLEQADLSGADLSGARLLGASLLGATLKGTRFHQAKLLKARLDPGALDGRGDDLWGAAHSQSGPPLPMMSASSVYYSVAYSPNGRFLAAGGIGSIQISDVESGLILRVIQGHVGPVLSVAFAPDGKTLASGSLDTTVRLWDADQGTERRVLKGHSQRVWSVAFAPNGKTLASGSDDSTVRLWDADQGTERRVLKGHSQRVWSVAFAPDGKTLASGSLDNTVRLWDADTGTERRVLRGHSHSVWSVAFAPDGKTLASGSDDSIVRLWDANTGTERRVLKGHSHSVWCVAFAPDGKTLASGSEDNTVRLWDVDQGTERRVLKGYSQRVLSVAFAPDGKTLASGSEDNTVRLWDTASGECLAVLVSLPEGWVAFTPDGRYRSDGALGGAFWHAVSLCRFEPGELGPYFPLRVPPNEPLYSLPR